jgi:Raf kinase inhibitor-like YbhB/YbcL family protein
MMRRIPFAFAVLLFWAGVAEAAGLTLQSPDLPAGQFAPRYLYDRFGCTGQNVSPALVWSDPPAGTRSFAVTLYDPDAPTGTGWWHWVIYDIPAGLGALSAGAGAADGGQLPAGARQTSNDFGAPGYGGPCPPAGDKPHRYVFTLYALDVAKLDAGPALGSAEIAARLKDRALATASFTAYHGRP